VASRDQGQDICGNTGPAQEDGRFGVSEGPRDRVAGGEGRGGGCGCVAMTRSRFV